MKNETDPEIKNGQETPEPQEKSLLELFDETDAAQHAQTLKLLGAQLELLKLGK